MTPESSVQAHVDLGAKTTFPIHCGIFDGIFDLTYQAWDEPIELFLGAYPFGGLPGQAPLSRSWPCPRGSSTSSQSDRQRL